MTDPRDGQAYATVTYDTSGVATPFWDRDEHQTYEAGIDAVIEVQVPTHAKQSMTWMAEDLRFAASGSYCRDQVNPREDVTEEPPVCEEAEERLYDWASATTACPPGWHLPTDAEWFLLAKLYGGVDNAGRHLKSEALRGSNASRFNARRGRRNIFWSASELDASTAWDWKLLGSWDKLQRWTGQKMARNLVRCVRDMN